VFSAVRDALNAALLAPGPDTLFIGKSTTRIDEMLLPQWCCIELSPTFAPRKLECELALALIPLIEQPKLRTMGTLHELHPIGGL
jgi:hypothetical protein